MEGIIAIVIFVVVIYLLVFPCVLLSISSRVGNLEEELGRLIKILEKQAEDVKKIAQDVFPARAVTNTAVVSKPVEEQEKKDLENAKAEQVASEDALPAAETGAVSEESRTEEKTAGKNKSSGELLKWLLAQDDVQCESGEAKNAVQQKADVTPVLAEAVKVSETMAPQATVESQTEPPVQVASAEQPADPVVPEVVAEEETMSKTPVQATAEAEPGMSSAPVSEPEATKLASAAVVDEETSEVSEENVEDDREPSAVDRRVMQLKNWLIYGNPDGCPANEAPEKLFATTWLLRVGILVIFCTSVFLLKLSIETGLLAPEGRVALSYLAGTGVLCWGMSRRMREHYWAIGQALIGIGLGVFYFSSYAMGPMYHIAPNAVAGGVMFMVTLTAGGLANYCNSVAVAMVAMVGGYATPLLLTSGSLGLSGLCAYLLLLLCGVLWLSYHKLWPQLVWLAILFTGIVSQLGFLNRFHSGEFGICIIALSVYFVLFTLSSFLYSVRFKREVTVFEIIGFIATSALYLFQAAYLISKVNNGDRLWYAPLTIWMSLFYFGLAVYFARRKQETEQRLLFTFCAFSGIYLAMTFPLIFSGNWLGTAWALQALLMLWLGIKLQSRFLRGCGWCLFAMTLGRLLCCDFTHYGRLYRTLDYGDGFWLGVLDRAMRFLIPPGCMAIGGWLMKSAPKDESHDELSEKSMNIEMGVMQSGSFVLCVLFLLFEVFTDFKFLNCAYRPWALTLVLSLAAVVAQCARRQKIAGWWSTCFMVLMIMLGTKCILWDYFQNELQKGFARHYVFAWNDSIGSMLNFGMLLAVLYYFQNLRRSSDNERQIGLVCRCLWPILLFCFSTTELKVILHHKLPGMEAGGISVLWGCFAFAAIYYGVSRGIPWGRYIGLSLFAVVVAKVFLYDMSQLYALWRVLAFLVFGILLICAAFVYLKYWHETADNEGTRDK